MGSIDTIKELLDLALNLKNHDLHHNINQLNQEIIEGQQERVALKQKVSELEDLIETKESLTYKDQVYWLEKNEILEGPFCPNCWDVNRKLVRLRILENNFRTCTNCKNGFGSQRVYP